MATLKSQNFVKYVIERSLSDNGFSANIRKAESEQTEIQAWEILYNWCDISNPAERKAYGLIGAFIAKNKIKQDGIHSIGKGLSICCSENSDSEKKATSSEGTRLRRLMDCDTTLEIIPLMRQTLNLLSSKDISICYAELLDQLIYYNSDKSKEKTCINWAKDFFGKTINDQEENQ